MTFTPEERIDMAYWTPEFYVLADATTSVGAGVELYADAGRLEVVTGGRVVASISDTPPMVLEALAGHTKAGLAPLDLPRGRPAP